VREYASHRKKVHTVAWNCSGTKLASGSVDTSVRVWTIDEGGRASDVELKGHSDSVDQLRWDPKNEHLLGTASGDKTVRIWDARTSKCVHAIETRGENINIRWSPDGQHLAVGDKEDNISIIETRKCKALRTMKFPHEVNEMAWDPSGRLFFLTTGAGNVDVFSFVDLLKPPPAPPKPGDGSAAPAPAATLTGHTANCYCLEFSPSGERFAVGGADALVSLWDVKELACVATFARLEWPVRTLSFSHDSSYIAAGSEDPLIDVAHVATGKQALAVPVKAPSNSIAFHPKRMLLAFAGDDKDKMGRDEGSLRILGFPS